MFKSRARLESRAQQLEIKGKTEQALEVYRDLATSYPDEVDLWFLLATKEIELGGSTEAAADAYFRAGDMLTRAGQIRDALDAYKQAIATQPSHGAARRVAAILERRLRRSEEDEAPPSPPPVETRPLAKDEEEDDGDDDMRSPRKVRVERAEEDDDEPRAVPAASASPPSVASPTLPPSPQRTVPPATTVASPAPPPSPRRTVPPATTVASPAPPPPPRRTIPPATNGGAKPVPVAAVVEEAPPAPLPTSPPLDEMVLAERLRSQPIADALEIVIDERPVDLFERKDARKLSALSSPFLAELDNALLQSLVEMAAMEHRSAGQTIFRQGEPGDRLFVILKGEVDVIREGPGAPATPLARLRAGTFFGEMALLTNGPRTATVRAAEDCELLVVSREQVQALIAANTDFLLMLLRFFRARLIGTLVQTAPLFKGLTLLERRDLVSKFRLLEIPARGVVIAEGRPSDGLSIVLSGRLEVVRTEGGVEKRLATLSQGDVYGEISLLTGAPAVATVRAETKVWSLALPRTDFESSIARRPSLRQLLERLSSQRRASNQAILAGEIPYAEGRIDPV